MLDRARTVLPGLRSLLMDRDTLLEHRASWVREPRQHRGPLERLTADEAALYAALVNGTYGDAVRLEQERIGFRIHIRIRPICVSVVSSISRRAVPGS